MTHPTVFISYSHKDEDWKDRLMTHLRVLEQASILDLWDDQRIGAGEDWNPEIEKAINAASVAVLMVTANFLTSRFILSEEVPPLLERREKEGLHIFPVIVKPCAWQQVKWLARMQARPKNGNPLSGGNEHQIDANLAAIAEEIAAIVKRVGHEPTPHVMVPLGPDKISIAKLPSTSADLFGREKELAALDAAWNDPRINVLSLVAWGGVGKTALVNRWRLQFAQDNYRGAERVYGWSFYSQGAAEGRQVFADPFIAAALTWFGDPDPTAGSPWDKGERLAELVKRQRTLLILDGLEPLQDPPTGKIKDRGLCSLLRELAEDNHGLVIVTTRLAVDDLKDFTGSRGIQIDLENLSPEAGGAYLAHLGVKGTTEELQRAATEFGGHALALTLLGGYLTTVYHGDVRHRDRIERLTDERKQGAQARRMMESYERWFEGKPELDILRLMGLFDRPAEAGALDALRKKPAIKGLTERVERLAHEEWQYAVEDLRAARLLSAPEPNEPDTLDCHPLLREHFGEKLQKSNPQAWRKAHSRLYEYYKSHAKDFPDTLDEMAPLFAAVAHGCQAGRHPEALAEVYFPRIARGNEGFNTRKLGAFGADLAVLSGFFDPPWRQPVAGLRQTDKSWVLGAAGFELRALGRLTEAAEPMKAALDATISLKDWGNAAVSTSNLSELYLAMGDIKQAIEYARQGVELADRSGDAFQQMARRTVVANTLYQAGNLTEAEAAFRQAEEMQKKAQPEFPLLYSLRGFQFCDLLLGQGNHREVQERAGKTLEWAKAQKVLLDIALDHLSLGRAHLLQAQSEGTGDYSQATKYLERAVEGLRQAGTQDQVPLGLLARAELRRVTGDMDKAQRDMDEAFSIATRGGMRLYEADCHLGYARLCLASRDKDKARQHLAQAKKMVEEMGYHRRDKEVEEVERQL